MDIAGLQLELQSPVSLLGEGQDVTDAESAAKCFAFPSATFIEADAEDTDMRVRK